jgi:hypothetical protein
MADVSKLLERDKKVQSAFLKKRAKFSGHGTLVRPRPVPVPEPTRPVANGSQTTEKK